MQSSTGAQSHFAVAPSIEAPRSVFNRSCGHKTTFDAGYLIPFFHDDVLPGDTFNLSTTIMARLQTLEFPVMDNMFLDTQFFFVPLRQIWDNARKFFGEQIDPGDSIDYTLPRMTVTPTSGSIHDYLGLPIGNEMTVTSIYHRACNHIYNHWYRDQNLQDSLVVDLDDGPDDPADYVLFRRGKRHDYFTSCLPWPQKGDAVSLPLGVSAPVVYNTLTTDPNIIRTASAGTPVGGIDLNAGTGGQLEDEFNTALILDPNGRMQVDLTAATAATINEMREAFQIQKLLERDARGGTRYAELIYNHFGVKFYDVSYRPEYLGGGSVPINISPVAATAATTGQVGDLGAFGTAVARGHGFTKSFVEHGIIIGFLSVRADMTYQQGIPREFLRQTRYDVYWPSLAHLGEQAVTNAEIYYTNTATDDDVFGYQERHAEYRYKPSLCTGLFRSDAAGALDAWHLAQDFTSLPALGPTFIEENPPVDRVVRYPTEPHFIMDSFTSLKCTRAMPVFGVPGMIDHF